MKKFVIGAALMALSLPAFSAPVSSLSGFRLVRLNDLVALQKNGLIPSSGLIRNLPASGFTALTGVTLTYLSATPLPGLVLAGTAASNKLKQ